MVLVIARQEAGLSEQRLNSRAIFSEDTEMRVGNQMRVGKQL
jgi:hypothetical protein